VRRLGDENALLVVRTRRRTEWRRLGRKDHELSGGGVRDLCVASRGHGPRALSAEELNGRPASPESRACARRCRLFEEAATCREDDCARHCSARSVRLGCGRQRAVCIAASSHIPALINGSSCSNKFVYTINNDLKNQRLKAKTA
jgi:hypothetical protein